MSNTTFDLTQKELKAAYILTRDALDECGGDRPSYFEVENYSWVHADVLVSHGYSKHEAAGFFSSLGEKEFIHVDEMISGSHITRPGQQWMESIWDDLWAVYNEDDSVLIDIFTSEKDAAEYGETLQLESPDSNIAWTTVYGASFE